MLCVLCYGFQILYIDGMKVEVSLFMEIKKIYKKIERGLEKKMKVQGMGGYV